MALEMVGAPVPVEAYDFGYGGDVDQDGVVGAADLAGLRAVLAGRTTRYPEHDADGDGALDEADLAYVKAVIAGRQPALLGARVRWDDAGPAIIEVRGYHAGTNVDIQVGDVHRPARAVTRGPDGRFTASRLLLPFERGRIVEGTELPVVVWTETGPAGPVPLRAARPRLLGGRAAPDVDELLSATAASDRPGVSTQCNCVSELSFVALVPDVRAFVSPRGAVALDRDGVGVAMDPARATRLSGPLAGSVLRIVGGGRELRVLPLGCDGLPEGLEIREAGAVGRARPILRVLAARRAEGCALDADSGLPGIEAVAAPRDNAVWPDGKGAAHPGSGAVARFSAPLDALADAGCERACWAQASRSAIDVYRAGRWTAVARGAWHNDAPDERERDLGGVPAPWFCAPDQIIESDALVFRPGPHLRHATGAGFTAGEVVRRGASLYTALLCLDGDAPPVLDVFGWSLTTGWRVGEGGATTVAGPFRERPSAEDPRARALSSLAAFEQSR